MKLHTVPGSPNGRKVEAVIHHLGLQVEVVPYNLFNGELRGPEYVAINPNSMVPTLVDGSFKLWESTAIMQYLADKAGDEQLLPRDPQARADVTRWQCWALAHFNKAFGVLAFETVAKPRNNVGAPDDTAIAQATTRLLRYAAVLDAHLAGRQYIVGQNATLADYSMLPFESYRGLVPFDWKPFANINAYFDKARMLEPWVRSYTPSAATKAVRAA
jgi:glutathione S-transferase